MTPSLRSSSLPPLLVLHCHFAASRLLPLAPVAQFHPSFTPPPLPREAPPGQATHIIRRIIVPNLLKPEIALEAHDPPRQPIQHLRQRRMDIKVVLPPYVLPREGTEMDFVKDDLVGVAYAVETDNEC